MDFRQCYIETLSQTCILNCVGPKNAQLDVRNLTGAHTKMVARTALDFMIVKKVYVGRLLVKICIPPLS